MIQKSTGTLIISLILSLFSLFKFLELAYDDILDQPEITLQKKEKIPKHLKVIINETRIDTIYYDSIYAKRINKESLQEIKKLNNRAFMNINTPVFRWITFHGILLAFTLGTALYLVSLLSSIFSRSEFTRWDILIIIISVISTMAFLFFLTENRHGLMGGVLLMEAFNIIFSNPRFIVYLVVIPNMIVCLLPLIGILAIKHITTKYDRLSKCNPDDYAYLTSKFKFFTFYLLIIVCCSIIGTSLQRDMITSQVEGIDTLYPKDFLYAYGLCFSIVLAVYSIPTYRSLKFIEPSSKGLEGQKKWWILNKENLERLQIAASIFLPLFTSLLQSVFSG